MKKIIFIFLLLSSCLAPEKRVQINCIYQGAIILQEHGGGVYDIKHKGEIIHFVNAYQIDAVYSVGDTINGKCL